MSADRGGFCPHMAESAGAGDRTIHRRGANMARDAGQGKRQCGHGCGHEKGGRAEARPPLRKIARAYAFASTIPGGSRHPA
jgi:hypothetical protein